MGLKGSNTNQTCFCGYAVCCFSAHTSPLPSLPPTPYASRLCIVNCFSTVIWQWVLQLSLSSTKCRDVVNKEVKGSRRIARNTSLYLELEKTGREEKNSVKVLSSCVTADVYKQSTGSHSVLSLQSMSLYLQRCLLSAVRANKIRCDFLLKCNSSA